MPLPATTTRRVCSNIFLYYYAAAIMPLFHDDTLYADAACCFYAIIAMLPPPLFTLFTLIYAIFAFAAATIYYAIADAFIAIRHTLRHAAVIFFDACFIFRLILLRLMMMLPDAGAITSRCLRYAATLPFAFSHATCCFSAMMLLQFSLPMFTRYLRYAFAASFHERC